MKYERISKELFESNRKKLLDRMMNNSIAIFFSNDQMPTNADGTMPFKQNSDLLWLSGIDQEESKLIIYRDQKGEMTEHLFLKEILFVVQKMSFLKHHTMIFLSGVFLDIQTKEESPYDH